ncbi:MAG: hypothetical protein MUE98_01765 [Rhodobacteraceae bacterium]|jgi:hypothetical protein|nr:hypothetical protein [Paracoccaceae bacterium]
MAPAVLWLVLAFVLGLIGWGMFTLTRHAVRVGGADRGRLGLVLAVPPALAYGLLILRIIPEVRFDPAAVGLWPMLVSMMLMLWMLYILVIRVVAVLSGRIRAPRA